MSARSKARKRALDILFQADVRGEDVALTLAAEARRAASEPAREASWLYAREIVDGVIDNAPAIDEAITAAAHAAGTGTDAGNLLALREPHHRAHSLPLISTQ